MGHSTNSPTHLLSKKSRSLHRDTFFFLPGITRMLLGGLNQSVSPVTSQKLHRWVRLLGESDQFELQPASVRHSGAILAYHIEDLGSSIPAESTDPLPPGDYLWEVTAVSSAATGSLKPPFATCPEEDLTFAQWKSEAKTPGPREHLAKLLPWYNIPSSLLESVTARDRGRCLITGSTPNDAGLGVSWIFPPAWADWVGEAKYYKNPSALCNSSNAMLMRKDLIDFFDDNAFGIDVDDNYRIVMFRDLGSARDLFSTTDFQAYFRGPGTSAQLTGPDDFWLRAHFKHCLRYHMLEGDISTDYPDSALLQAKEDFGLGEDSDGIIPLHDPRWQTELGKEIFASILQYPIDRNGYKPASEGNEDGE